MVELIAFHLVGWVISSIVLIASVSTVAEISEEELYSTIAVMFVWELVLPFVLILAVSNLILRR